MTRIRPYQRIGKPRVETSIGSTSSRTASGSPYVECARCRPAHRQTAIHPASAAAASVRPPGPLKSTREIRATPGTREIAEANTPGRTRRGDARTSRTPAGFSTPSLRPCPATLSGSLAARVQRRCRPRVSGWPRRAPGWPRRQRRGLDVRPVCRRGRHGRHGRRRASGAFHRRTPRRARSRSGRCLPAQEPGHRLR